MSDNGSMTITEFLEARIAEDEMAANDLMGEREGDRVLAECTAKRAIIDAIPPKPDDRYTPSWHYSAEPILRHLATVYAYHPDYRQEWAL